LAFSGAPASNALLICDPRHYIEVNGHRFLFPVPHPTLIRAWSSHAKRAILETTDRLLVDEFRDIDRIRCMLVQRVGWILSHLVSQKLFLFV
jgi:hypothetical protein